MPTSQRLEGWRTLSRTQSLSGSSKLHWIPIKKLLIFYRANAFALFLKSQRKWTSPPLSDHSVLEFKKKMKELEYGNRAVLPHGSYLINLGNPDE